MNFDAVIIPWPLVSFFTIFACAVLVPIFFGLLKFFGVYAIVPERQTQVFVLFGNVVGVLEEPGLHFLWAKLGWQALIVNWLGRCQVVGRRLDQEYLRSAPVNSEEGAPMGVGIWYEMFIKDPVSFLFKNVDPRGSLRASVSNTAVRALSNMKLVELLENRHLMSNMVRDEVTPQGKEWGYQLGSVYIRKVHFRDLGMTKQIEEKVVNRLRQVTSAIKQEGTNRVNIIAATAENQAAIEFAKAAAIRPRVIGEMLQKIGEDPDIVKAMFEVLENQRIAESKGSLVIVPPGGAAFGLSELIATDIKSQA